MKNKIIFFILFISTFALAQPVRDSATELVKKCIKRHGGWKAFSKVRDFYAKMNIISYSDKGEVESSVEQFFRSPDKLRSEISAGVGTSATHIGWDGKVARQMSKGKQEKVTDKKVIERLEEGIRFIKLMILTNLLGDHSRLVYLKKLKPKKKKFGFHIILQKDIKTQERIYIFISDKDQTLLGAEFFLKGGGGTTFKVFFDKQKKMSGLYLPKRIRLYRRKKLVLKARLFTAKINALRNKNSFFSNLKEKPNMKRKRGRRNARRKNARRIINRKKKEKEEGN